MVSETALFEWAELCKKASKQSLLELIKLAEEVYLQLVESSKQRVDKRTLRQLVEWRREYIQKIIIARKIYEERFGHRPKTKH